MAEFCKQCADELDFPADFVGLVTEDQHKKEHLVAYVLCEGCGYIQVDHEGRCMGCLTHDRTWP